MKVKEAWKSIMPKLVGNGLNILAIVSPEKAGDILLKAISKPRSGKIQSHQSKFLATADKQILDCEGFELVTYHWKGSGKKILLCHGWESNAWRWRKLIRHLKQEDYYIIGMDGPGHGASGSAYATTPLYASFINQASVTFKPDVLIGHSFGGYSSLYSLSHLGNPGISHLVILASPDKWTDIANAFLKAIGAGKRLKSGMDKAFKKIYNRPQEYYNASDYAKGVEIPGILIHDAEDMINKVDDGRSIAANWQKSQYFETNGFGHGLQAQPVFDRVLSYLKEIS